MFKKIGLIFVFVMTFSIGLAQPFNLTDNSVKLRQFQHLYEIYFELASSKLQKSEQLQLDSLVSFMLNNPTIEIELGAHTDFRGDDKSNLELSKKRAFVSFPKI